MGIGLGFIILIMIVLTGQMTGNTLKTILLLLVAAIFIISLFIINYSYKFKRVIGSISFSDDIIEIDFLNRKEIIQVHQLKNIKFKFAGYEGLNKSTIFENVMFPVTEFNYHGGINNFLYLNSGQRMRRFEFYIPNKIVWTELKKIAKQYHDKLI